MHGATVRQPCDVLDSCHLVKPELCLAARGGVERDWRASALRGGREVRKDDHVGVWNRVHLGDPCRPRLNEPLRRTCPSQSFCELHHELHGAIGSRGRGLSVCAAYWSVHRKLLWLGQRVPTRA